MAVVCWILTGLGALAGASYLGNVFYAENVGQQAAGAGIACAFVVIPYCVARAFQAREDAAKLDRILRALEPGGPKKP